MICQAEQAGNSLAGQAAGDEPFLAPNLLAWMSSYLYFENTVIGCDQR